MEKLVIKGKKPGPHIVLLAGVHGDEYEPMAACRKIYRELRNSLEKGKISIVPNVNPTAYQAGTRFGSDGLDLARICPGREDGTPSEQAAHAVSRLIRKADMLVDMHTGGLLYDIFPLAGYMLSEDAGILEIQRKMARSFLLPLVWGTDPLPNGRTLSVARDERIPAIYLEYGGGSGFRRRVVKTYVKGFLNLLKQFDMIHGKPEVLEEFYWVEDARPDSGYLQGKMPSPADGICMPRVKTGEQIRKGDEWATILDPATGDKVRLYADIDGLVFLQRTIAKVQKGDALGGILPITGPGKVKFDAAGSSVPF